jgi:hemerythrin-like domain-containing protein
VDHRRKGDPVAESPTRQLADEHEYVRLVVGAMEAEAAYVERTGSIHAERVAQMVDFTRNFTDGDHHTKEEDLLFPLLEERSASAGGTISVLLSEHQAARDCIRAIDEALPDATGSDPERAAEARAVVVENLRLYAYLLPLHIGKEDTVLFPLTERVLSVREQEMLGEEFGRLAAMPGRTATIDNYHRLAHELATPPAEE